MENVLQLADFGGKAWPRDPVLSDQKGMGFPRLQAVLMELAWRLVDQVAVQVQDGARHDVSVGTLLGYTSPNYSTRDTPSSASAPIAITAPTAVPGTPMLSACVLCVWSVYEAQRTLEGMQFASMSVHHKASVMESWSGEGDVKSW
jgi:hypothetical protein